MLTRRLAPLTLAALIACSRASSAAPSNAGGFAAALVASTSAKMVECGPWTPAAATDFVVSVYQLDPAWIGADASIGYDASLGQACLAALARMTCNQARLEPIGAPLACLRALVGTVAPGGRCTSTYACSEYGWCRYDACSAPGTCTASTDGPGATCSSLYACARGLTCQAGTCQPAPFPPVEGPAGSSCLVGPCPDTQYCDSSSLCRDRVPDGQACDASGPPCAWGAFCQGSKCVRYARAGDPCTPATSTCPLGTSCTPAGTCAVYPAVGDPCAGASQTDAGVPCSAGWCDAAAGAEGTCAPFKATGEACTTGSRECGSAGVCVTGTCRPSLCR